MTDARRGAGGRSDMRGSAAGGGADTGGDTGADSEADDGAAPATTAHHTGRPGTVQRDAWQALRRFTPARIAMGRAGQSLTTRSLLEFGLAQAQARDAVYQPSQQGSLLVQLAADGYTALGVHSAATDRQQYLRRPDLGRRLDDASRERLLHWAGSARGTAPPDVVFVVADGLSAQAAVRHALPLLRILDTLLTDWHLGPVVVADLARVALGDEIGAIMGARHVVMLIGERPGLSAPDSLGIYLTHAPRPGRTDAERNCISNVRPEGLTYDAAARRLRYLLTGAFRLGRTGIELKDESRGGGWELGSADDGPAPAARLSQRR